MALAVWLLYAADRLLDTRDSDTRDSATSTRDLEERHHFHRSHRRAFTAGIILASLVLAALVPRLYAPSIRLYSVLGTLLLAYFVLIHASSPSRNHRFPKELAVGIFFSAATFISTVSRQPALRIDLLPAGILFALLCSLNCLFIYAWEHPSRIRPEWDLDTDDAVHPVTRLALRSLRSVAVITSISGIALALFDPFLPWPVPAACTISAALLLVVNQRRHQFARTTLRAAADLCLLAPILFLPFLPR